MASTSFSALVEEHYSTLRRLAAREIRNRSGREQISPTSLVAESVMRLLQQREKPASADHLRGLATVFMARVLSDLSKSSRRVKRGGGRAPQPLDDTSVELNLSTRTRSGRTQGPIRSLIDRDLLLDAMESLAAEHPRQMEIVTLHLVGDIPMARVAELVGISERTAFRDLEQGRVALARRLRELHG